MEATDKLVRKYLNFSGDRTSHDFVNFLSEINKALEKAKGTDLIKLEYLRKKITHGLQLSVRYEEVYVIVDETFEDFEEMGKPKRKPTTRKKTKAKPKTKRKPRGKRNLGKIVDEGDVPEGRADEYWNNKEIQVIFRPTNKSIRSGQTVPSTYKYGDVKFLRAYFGFRGVEFGNWLSQQDRANYVSGLGLALFDLKNVIGFDPKEMGLNGKLSVAFGARGRGSALAHFDPKDFIINLTRYKRPVKVAKRKENYNRLELLTLSGGVGSFAHEFGHALDFYGGTYLERNKTFSLSHGKATRTRPDEELLKEKSLSGIMERVLFKIIWDKSGKEYSAYYKRLKQGVEKGRLTKYFILRAEIFARAFEVYVHYKMKKKNTKNIFLAENKYDDSVYMTTAEIRKVEKDIDELMSAFKKKI